jgi:hypothetical protein
MLLSSPPPQPRGERHGRQAHLGLNKSSGQDKVYANSSPISIGGASINAVRAPHSIPSTLAAFHSALASSTHA